MPSLNRRIISTNKRVERAKINDEGRWSDLVKSCNPVYWFSKAAISFGAAIGITSKEDLTASTYPHNKLFIHHSPNTLSIELSPTATVHRSEPPPSFFPIISLR